MKNWGFIILMIFTGCGKSENKLDDKVVVDPIRPPAPHEIIENSDGTYSVRIDESLDQNLEITYQVYNHQV